MKIKMMKNHDQINSQKMVEANQAMDWMSIAIATTPTVPLPAGRWDKYRNNWPCLSTCQENVEAQREELTIQSQSPGGQPSNETGRTIFRATDDYLVEINQNQRTRQGTISSMMNQAFDYKVSKHFVRVLKDNTDYEFSSDVMLLLNAKLIQWQNLYRTDQAGPQKHNKRTIRVLWLMVKPSSSSSITASQPHGTDQ